LWNTVIHVALALSFSDLVLVIIYRAGAMGNESKLPTTIGMKQINDEHIKKKCEEEYDPTT